MTLFLTLLWVFSCALSTTAAESYPLTAEFDVVFPRNDTYAPAPVFPIVFAMQNLAAASPTTHFQLHWALVRYGESRIAGDFVTLGGGNSTGVDYITAWTGALNATEAAGTYALGWDFTYTDCPEAYDGRISSTANRMERRSVKGSLFFTIKPGAQQPDLAADLDSCPAHHAAIGITGTLSLDVMHQRYGEFCGIIASSSPPANPCAARLDKAAASSIAAELTASACTASPPALTSGCPTSTEESLGVKKWPELRMLMGPLLAGLLLLALH